MGRFNNFNGTVSSIGSSHKLLRSSWKKSFDDREDNSSEKADEGIEQSQVEQTNQDKESIRLDAGEKIAGLSRSETHQDF